MGIKWEDWELSDALSSLEAENERGGGGAALCEDAGAARRILAPYRYPEEPSRAIRRAPPRSFSGQGLNC